MRSWTRRTGHESGARRRRSNSANIRSVAEHLEGRLLLSTILVTNTNASGPGSLDDAVAQANADAEPDTIVFHPALTANGPVVIKLSSPLVINSDVTIVGGTPGNTQVVLDGNGVTRLLEVGFAGSLHLSSIKITGGVAADSGGGIHSYGSITLDHVEITNCRAQNYGGGIYSNGGAASINNCSVLYNSAGYGGGLALGDGAITIEKTEVFKNTATGGGGGVSIQGFADVSMAHCYINFNTAPTGAGIANDNRLTVSDSWFQVNQATIVGGALDNSFGGTATAVNCSFIENSAGAGGAVSNAKAITLVDCKIFNNGAFSRGGGLSNAAIVGATVTGCTFSGNTVLAVTGTGGGIDSPGPIVINNSTITGNRASSGGGGARFPNGNARANNTIFSANTNAEGGSPSDVAGTLDPDSHANLIGSGGSGGVTDGVDGNRVGVDDPRLVDLSYNGKAGYLVPAPDSPARDAGDASRLPPDTQDLDHDGNTTKPLSVDGRGLERVHGLAMDIGAIEAQPAVAGRVLFANDSALDAGTPGPGADDDAAVDALKQPLVAGETASSLNVSNSSKGINGVMVDFIDLEGGETPDVNDFDFQVCTDPDGSTWVPAPPPSSVTRRPGAGVAGGDRVEIIWPDNVAVRNAWLQVVVKNNLHTGLFAPDSFTFGNLVGDTGANGVALSDGGELGTPRVDVRDMQALREHFRARAAEDLQKFDVNRDGKVDAADLFQARINQRHFLPLIDAPAAGDVQAAASIAPAAGPFEQVAPARRPSRRGMWLSLAES